MNQVSYEQAIWLHSRCIEDFGGSQGVRDDTALLAALARPYATFDGVYLYKDAFEKAAAIGESIIINHPFVDGNKRTGFELMMFLMYKSGMWINATSDQAYQFVLDLTTGTKRFDDAVKWLREHAIPFE